MSKNLSPIPAQIKIPFHIENTFLFTDVIGKQHRISQQPILFVTQGLMKALSTFQIFLDPLGSVGAGPG